MKATVCVLAESRRPLRVWSQWEDSQGVERMTRGPWTVVVVAVYCCATVLVVQPWLH